jgi:uncharacterized protein (DUF983 family)
MSYANRLADDDSGSFWIKVAGVALIVVGIGLFLIDSPAWAVLLIVGLLTLILGTLRDILHRMDNRP